MPKATHSTPETLYHHWRKGDASAGQALAQRFTDWYYAISVVRLGEQAADLPFRAACKTFSKGVSGVDDARRLLAWAHNIAVKQIHAQADLGRIGDGDLPNGYSRKQSPKQLLVKARAALPYELHLLEHAYLGHPVADPQAVLAARYDLKAWLRTNLEVPFKVLPSDPDPDRAPLALYEAGRLASETEDATFELYMLSDVELCQDVAEFAHFAIALRGGLPGEIPAAGHARTPVEPPPPVHTAPAPPPAYVPAPARTPEPMVQEPAVAAPATPPPPAVVRPGAPVAPPRPPAPAPAASRSILPFVAVGGFLLVVLVVAALGVLFLRG